jgi:hypothetical protein
MLKTMTRTRLLKLFSMAYWIGLPLFIAASSSGAYCQGFRFQFASAAILCGIIGAAIRADNDYTWPLFLGLNLALVVDTFGVSIYSESNQGLVKSYVAEYGSNPAYWAKMGFHGLPAACYSSGAPGVAWATLMLVIALTFVGGRILNSVDLGPDEKVETGFDQQSALYTAPVALGLAAASTGILGYTTTGAWLAPWLVIAALVMSMAVITPAIRGLLSAQLLPRVLKATLGGAIAASLAAGWYFGALSFASSTQSCAHSRSGDLSQAFRSLNSCYSRFSFRGGSMDLVAGHARPPWQKFFRMYAQWRTPPSTQECPLSKPRNWQPTACADIGLVIRGECYRCGSGSRSRVLFMEGTSEQNLFLVEGNDRSLEMGGQAIQSSRFGFHPEVELAQNTSTSSSTELGQKLLDAIRANDPAALLEALAESPDPLAAKEAGLEPMLLAIDLDRDRLIPILDEWREGSRYVDAKTYIARAAKGRHYSALGAILKAYGNSPPGDLGDLLFDLAADGNDQALHLIISKFPNTYMADPLRKAVATGLWKSALLLADEPGFQRGGDMESLALVAAAGAGNLESLQRHLAMGGRLDFVIPDGRTAALVAAQEGQVEALELLLKRGADSNVRDHEGRNILMLALNSTNPRMPETVKLLHQWVTPAVLSSRDPAGKTASDYARQAGRPDLVPRR